MSIKKSDLYAKHDPEQLLLFQEACIGIAGCGGLGSNVATSLVRSGIGKLVLVDFDIVEPSNLNRQQFFYDQIGMNKVEALQVNLKRMNPFVHLETHHIKVTSDNIGSLFSQCDILIEAFDLAEEKIMLLEVWVTLYPEKPIICASGVFGVGKNENIHMSQFGNIWVCGDEEAEIEGGLTPLAPKVSIIANMQANQALYLITLKQNKKQGYK